MTNDKKPDIIASYRLKPQDSGYTNVFLPTSSGTRADYSAFRLTDAELEKIRINNND